MEGLWRLYVEQVCLAPFFQYLLISCLCVTSDGNSHNISDFFIIIIFVMVICDQCSLMLLSQKDYNSLKAQTMVSFF